MQGNANNADTTSTHPDPNNIPFILLKSWITSKQTQNRKQYTSVECFEADIMKEELESGHSTDEDGGLLEDKLSLMVYEEEQCKQWHHTTSIPGQGYDLSEISKTLLESTESHLLWECCWKDDKAHKAMVSIFSPYYKYDYLTVALKHFHLNILNHMHCTTPLLTSHMHPIIPHAPFPFGLMHALHCT